MKRHKNSGSYGKAINECVQRRSLLDNIPHATVRRSLVFDVLLARLARADHGLVLRGGFAMEMRFNAAPSSGDIDFSASKKLKVLSQSHEMGNFIKTRLEDVLSTEYDRDDSHFEFRIQDASSFLDQAGGFRYPVKVFIDGKEFETFNIDIGINDFMGAASELLSKTIDPSLGSGSSYKIETVPLEQLFAENLFKLQKAKDESDDHTGASTLYDLYKIVSSDVNLDALRQVTKALFAHKERPLPSTLPESTTKQMTLLKNILKERGALVKPEEVRSKVGFCVEEISSK